jgi:hypothetical protein
MPRLTPAAIGFRVHSGWAVAVAVSGSPLSPVVLDRRRIEIADRSIRGSVQPYHAAKELGMPKAESFLKRCSESSQGLAQKAIHDLRGRHQVIGCGILLSSGRLPVTLEETLASHAAIHTAEGEFFREVIRRACDECGLSCMGIREKELLALAAPKFGADVQLRLNEVGKTLGPPWRQDEKYAALVAWLILN